MFDLKDFVVGDCIELHSCVVCQAEYAGLGTVQKIGRKLLTVKMHTSGKLIKVHPGNIGKLNGIYA